MASAAQVRANTRNAQHSTGPVTEAGKQATRRNALKHGLAAEKLVLTGDEDAATLEALRAQLHADYAPVSETELMLVEDLAQCWFRLQRARWHETRVLDDDLQSANAYSPLFLNVLRYGSAAERGYYRALKELRAVLAARPKTAQPAEAQPHPAETVEVEPIGSVPQNDAERPDIVNSATLLSREYNWATMAMEHARALDARKAAAQTAATSDSAGQPVLQTAANG